MAFSRNDGGYPVVDVEVELIDGQADTKDSNESIFHLAAIFAVKDALCQAGAILLEPIMDVEYVAPGEQRGDLFGNVPTTGAGCSGAVPNGPLSCASCVDCFQAQGHFDELFAA